MAAEGVMGIVDVQLIPYGNAVYPEGGKLDCQHGGVECVGNSMLQCAIDGAGGQKSLAFASCFERYGPYFWMNYNDTSDPGHVRRYGRICAWEQGLDFSKIEACVNDPVKATKLQQKYRGLTNQTRGLYPHVYDLTWVTVNGARDATDGAQLLKEICAAYTGTPPRGCSSDIPTGGHGLTGARCSGNNASVTTEIMAAIPHTC
jgi:interferon gamma-inducible protein 30